MMLGAGSIDLPAQTESFWAERCMEKSVCEQDWEILGYHGSNGEARPGSPLIDDLSGGVEEKIEERKGEQHS